MRTKGLKHCADKSMHGKRDITDIFNSQYSRSSVRRDWSCDCYASQIQWRRQAGGRRTGSDARGIVASGQRAPSRHLRLIPESKNYCSNSVCLFPVQSADGPISDHTPANADVVSRCAALISSGILIRLFSEPCANSRWNCGVTRDPARKISPIPICLLFKIFRPRPVI